MIFLIKSVCVIFNNLDCIIYISLHDTNDIGLNLNSSKKEGKQHV